MLKFRTHPLTPILLVISLCCMGNISVAQTGAKIVGGKPSNPDAFPWMAGLVRKSQASTFQGQYCGASLIASQWVLTAAHCVFSQSKATVDVVINRYRLDDEKAGERLAIDHIIMHPDFDNESLINDIALLKLHTPSQTPPIAILPAHSNLDNARQDALALGWGTTSNDFKIVKKYPQNLRQVDLPIVDNAICADDFNHDFSFKPRVTDNMLCAGYYFAEKDTCQGDSGGPLIVFDNESNSWKQAGITSWGKGCARIGFYGVYTRIKNYNQFISNTLCSASERQKPVFLQLAINGNQATALWNASNGATGYRLHYAPYPEAQPISTIEMDESTQFSADLSSGEAYYVAITSYNDYCDSGYSNIEHFTIK